MEKLWNAIFQAVRIRGDSSAVEQWQEHLQTLHRRLDRLNALRFKSLHYVNSWAPTSR